MIEPHLTPTNASGDHQLALESRAAPFSIARSSSRSSQLTSKRGIWLMTDECYCQFLYDGEAVLDRVVQGAKDTVLVAGSLSKTYAMTGWRIGFGLGPQHVMAAVNKLQSHSRRTRRRSRRRARSRRCAGRRNRSAVMLAEYRRRRDFVIAAAAPDSGRKLPRTRGRVLRLSGHRGRVRQERDPNSMQFAERLLEEAHVAVVPGEAFGTEKHVRISYADFDEGSGARYGPARQLHPAKEVDAGRKDRAPVR